MTGERIRSYREFERRYFPETVAKRERDKETPEETGRRWAREALGALRHALTRPTGDPEERG